jgi:hypothetical protein
VLYRVIAEHSAGQKVSELLFVLAGWRARVVAYGAPRVETRPFEIDVLACPRCGGRLRLIATVDGLYVSFAPSRPP